jgi:hypothetical protein
VERSGLVNRRRDGRCARKILFSASRYSFCHSAAEAADSPSRSRTLTGARLGSSSSKRTIICSLCSSTFEFLTVRRGACWMYFLAVRGETRICSLSQSSSAIRSSPQVRFSAALRRIKRRTCVDIAGRSTGFDFQRQKRRKAARCQPINVAGLTITKAPRQSKKRASLDNTNRSAAVVGTDFSRALGITPTAYAGTSSLQPERSGYGNRQRRSSRSHKQELVA